MRKRIGTTFTQALQGFLWMSMVLAVGGCVPEGTTTSPSLSASQLDEGIIGFCRTTYGPGPQFAPTISIALVNTGKDPVTLHVAQLSMGVAFIEYMAAPSAPAPTPSGAKGTPVVVPASVPLEIGRSRWHGVHVADMHAFVTGHVLGPGACVVLRWNGTSVPLFPEEDGMPQKFSVNVGVIYERIGQGQRSARFSFFQACPGSETEDRPYVPLTFVAPPEETTTAPVEPTTRPAT